MNLKFKKLHPDAVSPTYATKGAACFDLTATEIFEGDDCCTEYRTGLSFEIPYGWVMLVFSRSGISFNTGAGLVNGVGVIDSDYRGEVIVKYNGSVGFGYNIGDRIAQAMLIPIQRLDLIETDTMNETERGANGFGSTGR